MKILLKAAAILSLATSVSAGAEGWVTDYEAAKAQAAREGKDLFINFTGSDWCGFCKVLDKEVFSKEVFMREAGELFVMVELDFPRKAENKAKLSEELKQQNKALKKQHKVKGYPIIYLSDAQGRPYARTGFLRVTPEKYVENLIELSQLKDQRDGFFAVAKQSEGVEKAKMLVKGLNVLRVDSSLLKTFYSDEMQAIAEADPDDQTGFMHGIETQERIDQLTAKVNDLLKKKKLDSALNLLDEAIHNGGHEPYLVRQFYTSKAKIHFSMKQYDDALMEVDKALLLEPDNRKASMGLATYRKRIEAAKAKAQAAPKPAPTKPDPAGDK